MSESLGPPPERSVAVHGRIQQLDGLRAVAILAILIHHNLRVPLLWVGVDIFFVLSGFLITGILLSRKASGVGYFSYFYSRRAFRILPAYIAVIVVTGFLFSFRSFTPWPSYVFFAMNMNGLFWHSIAVPLPLWSLAVEEQFYLIWPVIILFISEKMLFRVAIGAILVTPFLRFFATPLFPTSLFIYNLTPFRADLLCAGAALAILWKDRTPRFEQLCRARAWVGFLAGFGLMALLQIWPVFRLSNNTRSANAIIYSLSLVGSLSLVTWTLADRGWLFQFLTWGPMRFIGRISYTMYLVGSMVKVLFLRHFHSPMLVMFLDISGTIVWASISWFVLERPILNFAARKTGSRAGKTRTERIVGEGQPQANAS
jgi:peptidoglycan/LPS O-acetylase OafA/YrhL